MSRLIAPLLLSSVIWAAAPTTLPACPDPPGIESLVTLAGLHERLEESIRDAEAEREEGGAEWVAQHLLDETLSPHLRNQAALSSTDWQRVQIGVRAVMARELVAAGNPRGAVAQLFTLEHEFDVDRAELTRLWGQCLVELGKPTKKDGGLDRAEFLFRHCAEFVRRNEPDEGDVEERLTVLCKKAKAKARPPRGSARPAEPMEPGKKDGLLARVWRTDRDKFESRLRKRPDLTEVVLFDEEESRVRLLVDHSAPNSGLSAPPFVARTEGHLVVEEPGVYRLRFIADDAGRLDVAESRAIDVWNVVTDDAHGKYFAKRFARELWLDPVTPIRADVWDAAVLLEMKLWLERRTEHGHWHPVPFRVTHDRGR